MVIWKKLLIENIQHSSVATYPEAILYCSKQGVDSIIITIMFPFHSYSIKLENISLDSITKYAFAWIIMLPFVC